MKETLAAEEPADDEVLQNPM
ncbi:hypothetical protein PA598K_07155, partial [Paenibacillus sp. 598K]